MSHPHHPDPALTCSCRVIPPTAHAAHHGHPVGWRGDVIGSLTRRVQPGVVDDHGVLDLADRWEPIDVPPWNGVRPRWDGVCVMSAGVTGWLIGELPARWLARHCGFLLDVMRLDSAIGRLRLQTIPHNACALFDSVALPSLPSLHRDMRAAGGRIFASCDDFFWQIPPWVPLDPNAPHHRADLARIERSLIEADGLVVHTPRMAEQVQHLNRSIRVIPQALPPLDELPRPKPGPHSGIRIGWAGTASHHGDLEMIAPAILQLLARRRDVTFVLAGSEFPSWASAARSSPQIELHPGWVSLPGYYRWVASLGLDVFVAPLVDIPYNAVKPCLKPPEAAGLGIPVIASAVGSYAEELRDEETALLVANTTEAWLAALTRMMEDTDLRTHLSGRGRAWAATRTIDQTGPLWADLWDAA